MSGVLVQKKVFNVKEHIKRIFPRATKVVIDWRKKPDHKIEAKIEVNIPRNKIIAVKSDENLKKALDKTSEAVLRQLKKAKNKNK